jgi:hypothetical protein
MVQETQVLSNLNENFFDFFDLAVNFFFLFCPCRSLVK